MTPHIGSRIKQKFEEKCRLDSTFNKAAFARRIHVHRSTVYHIFERQSIDTDLLRRISKALGYDFTAEVFGQPQESAPAASPKVIVGIELTLEQLKEFALPSDFLHLIKQTSE